MPLTEGGPVGGFSWQITKNNLVARRWAAAAALRQPVFLEN
jgi:hypothetical protein